MQEVEEEIVDTLDKFHGEVMRYWSIESECATLPTPLLFLSVLPPNTSLKTRHSSILTVRRLTGRPLRAM